MSISWGDAALATLFWLLALYLFRSKPRSGQRWSDRRANAGRFLVLFLAISLSFQIDPFAARFDALVGLNNLSWMLAYGNAVAAAYAGVLAMVIMAKRTIPRRLNVMTVVMLGALFLLYPALASTPEEFHNTLPQSAALLIFRELLYAYLALMAIVGIRIHLGWLRDERFDTGKFRGAVLLVSLCSGVAFFLSRAVGSLFVYFSPDTFLYNPLLRTSNVLAGIAIAGLACAFAPPTLYRLPVRTFTYLKQRLALRNLEHLRNQMLPVTGELPWPPPSQRDRWFDTPYALYCTLIDVLDRANILHGLVVDNNPKITPAHRRLVENLERLPNTKDWVELLPYMRQLSRKL